VPYYIYYLEIKEQKATNIEQIERLSKEKIIEEARAEFKAQEREKERVWDKRGQKWPTNHAS
jgi:hypothetical protein